jgi:multidrug transporter EmrE-like cation transporter
MQARALTAIAVSVLLTSAGQLTLKYGVERGRLGALRLSEMWGAVGQPFIVLGVVLYALSAVLWVYAIARVPLSYAYPLVAGSYVVVALASRVLFQESLPPLRLVGLAAIVFGVVAVARS